MNTEEKHIWGIHTQDDKLFLQDNTIAIGWRKIGDLSLIGNSRDAFKRKYAETYPDKTKQSIANGVGMLYRFCHEVQIGDYMVGDKLKRPKMVEKQIECFSVAEQKQIEQAVKESIKPYMMGVVICLYTGLRIGELLALEWSDIDFSSGTLSVDKTCHYGKNRDGKYERIVDTPKTETSIRIIPIL